MEVCHSNLGSDANSIIMKITSGLQSNNLGLQCEAIAEFSNIVKKYPFPIVISPIFVQIIEAFHRGPNYLRLIVIKSCNTCLEHIDKLTCAEDIISNLSLVMVSNDPCARALCLKLLGLLHPIFCTNKSVHHMIILGLDSHYDIELNAAIEASNSYAPISRDFAGGLCNKLCVKLESLSTDLNLKIQLIKLARYLHHNADTIEETRKCLISLLNRYRSLEFVINIVDTLTILNTRSAIHARSQIDVLIEQIQIEDREPVILAILRNKLILARRMSHIWSEEHISFLCHLYHKADPTKPSNLIANCTVIEILSVLAESSCPASIFHRESHSKNPVLVLIIECASAAALIESSDSATDVVSRINYFGINLLTVLSAAIRDLELAEHTLNAFSVNVGTHWQKPNGSFKYISHCNKAILKLFHEFQHLSSGFLSKNIAHIVQEFHDGKQRNNIGFSLFCRFITKFCLNLRRDVTKSLPSTTSIIEQLHSNGHSRIGDQYLSICAFLFQLANCEGGIPISEHDSRQLIEWLVGSKPNDWLLYRIGRLANRYNQHGIASAVYRLVLPSVISPRYVYWIQGLIEISDAETLLVTQQQQRSDDLIEVLVAAQRHFHRATSAFKCSGGGGGALDALWWAGAYVAIRCEWASAVYTLVATLHQLRSSRACAKAARQGAAPLDEVKTLFRANSVRISELIGRSVDADDDTIERLQWLRQLSSVFLQALQHDCRSDAFVDDDDDNSDKNTRGGCHQRLWLRRLCEEISSAGGDKGNEPIGEEDAVADKLRLLMTLANNAVRIAVPFPRYMFQQLQHTEVRLMAVLNGKAVGNEASGAGGTDIPLRQDQSHKLHVFGIIQQRCKIGTPIRTVSRVEISASLLFHQQQPSKLADSAERPQLVVEKTVRLNNDYFTSHILLDLKKCSPVRHQLVMRASLIDTTGARWQTRDVSSCIVKVEPPTTNGITSKTPNPAIR